MLDHKVIIYDDSCPMCKLYSYWFVAWGFLKPENRIGFATAPAEITSRVDLDRGRHEIPLYDRSTGETIYGLSALTHILESRWAFLKPIFKSKPFWWTFYPIYQIITFNRRVIAGCKHCCGFDCAPDLNRFYRSVYLGIATLVIATVIWALAMTSSTAALSAVSVFGAFGFVGMVCGTLRRITGDSLSGWNYAGNYMTTLLIVSVLLLPIAWSTPNVEAPINLAILIVAGLFGLEELRRREL